MSLLESRQYPENIHMLKVMANPIRLGGGVDVMQDLGVSQDEIDHIAATPGPDAQFDRILKGYRDFSFKLAGQGIYKVDTGTLDRETSFGTLMYALHCEWTDRVASGEEVSVLKSEWNNRQMILPKSWYTAQRQALNNRQMYLLHYPPIIAETSRIVPRKVIVHENGRFLVRTVSGPITVGLGETALVSSVKSNIRFLDQALIETGLGDLIGTTKVIPPAILYRENNPTSFEN